MSQVYKAVRANLYSVHWQNDAEHGYYNSRVRIMATDALDAIRETIPQTAGKVHVASVDMLAENVTILVSENVLTDGYASTHQGAYTNEEWRKMLGTTELEHHHGYGRRGA